MPKNSNEYQRKYQNEWYKNQSIEYKQRQKILKEKRVEANKQFLIEKRSVPCFCCQEIHPQEIMEFHHIDGSPEARVSHLTGNSRKRLQEEVDKCVVVCPNCHTKIHKSILTLLQG
jgi:hypothetical protein